MITVKEIAKMIDHSILHPTFTDIDLEKNCEIAKKYDVATVCVKPYHVRLASDILKGSDVAVCAVIGFPHGNSTVDIKKAETLQVIKDGATEVDMVINIGKVLQNDWNYIDEELRTINDVCINNGAILKVIFETDFIKEDNDKIKLCELCNKNKTAFVKTSTGYGFVKRENGYYNYSGATEHDIKLMRKHCNSDVQVKASGGIRSLDQILIVKELGATRVGVTATKIIIEEAIKRFKNNMKLLFSIHWVLVSALWYFGNGILHDIFVLINHKGKYDRELLRLLMNGHVLILSGVIVFICYVMMLNKIQYGGVISIIVGVGMLIYCAMIFPFLKSFGTIAISIMLIIVSIKAINSFPDINNIMQNYK